MHRTRRRRLPTRSALALALTTVTGILAAPQATAATAPPPATPTAASALAASWTAPLSTRGRWIVDANGDRFKLKSANWAGAQGTWNGSGDINDPANHHSGENANGMPLGLDRATLPAILAGFHAVGVNSIRLPFSNEMVHATATVPDAAVAANPQLRGKTPLQVFDAVVAALTADGFAVVLNNHTGTTRWCCGVDGNERWNTSRSTADWVADWVTMANRYKTNKRVVGADLYNEVRRNILDDPNWGWGNDKDWQAASLEAGNRILTEANPDLLIIVEGINWTGVPLDNLPHGRPTLTPVRTLSHTLVNPNKLVYSAHFYAYTGPNHSGAYGLGETHDPRYQDLTRDQLFAEIDRSAQFTTADGQHYTAPVWISEFGTGAEETNPVARSWFTNFTDYLVSRDLDFAYWPLVGWKGNGQGDSWALLRFDPTGARSGIADDPADWRATGWNKLINAPARTGAVAASARWNMLSLDHSDAQASLRMRGLPDWDSGARKGTCPDGQRVIGLSHTGNRGLCTDTGTPGPTAPTAAYTVVRDQSYVQNDWATGYTKLECPTGRLMTGYSVRGAAVSAILCTQPAGTLGTQARTLWFDRADNRPAGLPGGEFADGNLKGQCNADEYAAGVAYTGRVGSAKTPDALLCKRLS
ncbi:glycoside hydrolase family 5 protein [Embleya sp. NBC_00896]|uniref:glycoside hydrolase family 5 protein n=1 Tax=Embleya sp. NBC_00896 TaxID=2975961 RepID=UPI003866E03F|nr:glycoside hydrolase family 5 protein [Embleya sp. NBC_00896]